MPNVMNLTGLPTMADYAAAMRTSGLPNAEALANVVELQSQVNKVLGNMPIYPCNSGTMEKALIRSALPEVAWRMANKGIQSTKSQSKQASFTCGHAQAYNDIDKEIFAVNGMDNDFRLSEMRAHQEAMAQKMATTLFYGDENKNPAGFTGLSAYFYSKANQDSVYADQIIDAGGTGDNLTSIWLATFSHDTVYGIFPTRCKPGEFHFDADGNCAGVSYEDKGEQQITQDDGSILYGYRTELNWHLGLAVRDPRHVVRIANVDVSSMNSTFINKLIEGYEQLYNPDHGRTMIMMNRKAQTLIDILAQAKSNVNLTIDEFAGKKMTHFWGAPILRCDAILSTESQVI